MDKVPITPLNLWEQMLEKKHLLNFDYGFTIPFMVGAYYKRGFLNDDDLHTSYCIRYLLENILESASPQKPVKIFDCPELDNELVLQYLSTMIKDPIEVLGLEQIHPNINQMIYWHKKELNVFDLDSLVSFLWNKKSTRGNDKYAQVIERQCFSCHIGVWRPFDPEEDKFIENL